MVQQVINLGTPPSGVDGDTTRTALQKSKENFADLYILVDEAGTAADDAQSAAEGAQTTADANIIPKGYIDGLYLVRTATRTLTITSGAAYVQGEGKVLRVDADLVYAGLVLAASTWYHAYLYDNAGTPAVELVTTAPAAPYNGSARAKTGDTSRRYIGSVLTDTANNIVNFKMTGNLVSWLTSIADAPFMVVGAGRATAVTNVSCDGAVPVTADQAMVIMAMVGSTDALIGNSMMSGTLTSTSYLQYISGGVATTDVLSLDNNRAFSYRLLASVSTGGFYARVKGYVFER